MYKILLSLLVFVQVAAYAQTGTLKGIASDSSNAEALIGAVVSVVENNAIGGVTEVDGSFLIEGIPAGTYNFKISYLGYKDRIIEGVTIQTGQTTDMGSLTLAADNANDLAEVTVIGIKEKASEAAVVQEIREADQVVSGISSEQISKGQDRDAAQVVQRIPGVSVVDNRFIMIRGLNDRYNTVWLNDATAPSMETDRKAFSFDMIPSTVIERILVFKTPSPELPGDYAGGLVKIFTKTPTRKLFNVGVGIGYRDGTTFSSFTKDKSPTDFLGFDNGQRALPSGLSSLSNTPLPASEAEGKKFKNNNSSLQNNNAPLDLRLGMTYSNTMDIKGKQLGLMSAINYSNTNTTFSIKREDSDQSGELTGIRTEKQYTKEVRLGAIANLSLVLNPGNKIEFRNYFIQNGVNQFVDRNLADATGSVVKKQQISGFRSRTIYNTQLAGKHERKNSFFDWTLGYTISKRNEPDQRRAIFSYDQSEQVFKVQTATSGNDINNGTSRFFQKLNESTVMGSGNFTQKFKLFNEKVDLDLNLGTYIEARSRQFNARVFGYSVSSVAVGSSNFQNNILYQGVNTVFDPSNVSYANGFTVTEDVNLMYKYNATNQLAAFYASVNLKWKKIKILTGVRYENNVQYIASGSGNDPLNTTATTNYFLPSINLSYEITDRQLIRFAYGKSLNRPEFREKAPFLFYDFNFLAATIGNTNLKVASIQNYDLRYEFYPTPEEMISVALFYKDFTDAIETVAANTAQLQYSYANAPKAYVTGIEIDIKKNLGFITERAKNFSLLFNTSLIKSQVTLPQSINNDYWSTERPLQGQSPYVINAG
ncbi:MAG: TonB-dependent receptor, partial [Cytophagaceae bacterium]|nr:TonB-dependent receptor [Cytophagaceae bacterium]